MADKLLTLACIVVFGFVIALPYRDLAALIFGFMCLGMLFYAFWWLFGGRELAMRDNEQHFEDHTEQQLLDEQAYYQEKLNEVDAKLLALDNERPEPEFICDMCGCGTNKSTFNAMPDNKCPMLGCVGIFQHNKEWGNAKTTTRFR